MGFRISRLFGTCSGWSCCRFVPNRPRRSSYSLSATKWQYFDARWGVPTISPPIVLCWPLSVACFPVRLGEPSACRPAPFWPGTAGSWPKGGRTPAAHAVVHPSTTRQQDSSSAWLQQIVGSGSRVRPGPVPPTHLKQRVAEAKRISPSDHRSWRGKPRILMRVTIPNGLSERLPLDSGPCRSPRLPKRQACRPPRLRRFGQGSERRIQDIGIP